MMTVIDYANKAAFGHLKAIISIPVEANTFTQIKIFH